LNKAALKVAGHQWAGGVIQWRMVPWSLWAYVALATVGMVVTLLTVSVPLRPLVFFVVVTFAWNFFLLRALRWLWIVTLVVLLLAAATDLVTGVGTWYGHLIGLISVGLLFLPATRRFFGIGKTAAP
jgi:hypothetical protein